MTATDARWAEALLAQGVRRCEILRTSHPSFCVNGFELMNIYIEYFIAIATVKTLVACSGFLWILFVPFGVDRRNDSF